MASYPTPQATRSSTFHVPPEFLEGKLALPALWDLHMKNSPEHALYIYEGSGGEIKHISWKEAVRATHRAAHELLRHISLVPGIKKSNNFHGFVVGVLAFDDTPTSWALITAVMHLGAIPLLLSPHNSPAAIADMLYKSGCRILVASTKSATRQLAERAVASLPSTHTVKLVSNPSYEDCFQDLDAPFHALDPIGNIDIDSAAFVMHSSGTMSFPKLVYISHRRLMNWSLHSYYGDKDLCGYTVAAAALPLYHCGRVE